MRGLYKSDVGASARAHVHTSFERWCLLARSSIADQGVILVYIALLRAEREARSESTFIYRRKVSMSGRPWSRSLNALFLWNGMTNSRTVILIRCHHPINHVFDRYRYPPVPATARGTCRGEGVGDTLSTVERSLPLHPTR